MNAKFEPTCADCIWNQRNSCKSNQLLCFKLSVNRICQRLIDIQIGSYAFELAKMYVGANLKL